ncbi:XRE family transcriptional regulator [Bradyrhizobium frederickii]|uniref:XRE family transcriptional regulator n=1 Tax=Bradyrhizobium frederickii TaxID=2560054 RepID=A0A4Y9L539_9BRAD|nr:helix-turn-helix transcriptional regulator [Bradyrhizobium frederickii]TFV37797.1 XRE family transcriptional regulator [Bradyrhizobium frederickii]
MADPRRVEFGDFLRSRREKLSPKTVGLPAGRRRRTAGLRREEVAQLAGIGVDWYIRLEQGRTVSPSVTTIDALARALRLSKAEHAHLKALARDGARGAFTREIVPPPIRRMIASLHQPAYVTGRRWDVLAWNEAAEDIFAFGQLPEQDRNTLLLVMTNKQMRKFYGATWTEVAKSMVAMFRATHDVWAGDPAFAELLTRLRQGSPEFVKWWEAHDIRSTMSGLKTMNHPTRGLLRFEHTSFQANDDPALKLVIYTPVEGGD